MNARGDFFVVDVDVFHSICDREPIGAALAYLILACGTGRDNVTSTWSAEAVKNYGGYTWRKAKDYVDRLIGDGFVERIVGGRKPRFRLLVPDPRRALSPLEQTTVDQVERGEAPATASEKNAAYRAEEKGWLERAYNGALRVKECNRRLAWLPNELATGVAGAPPPLFRLSRAGEIDALRLLVDLYSLHDLPEHGGVSRELLHQEYERKLVASVGSFDVWRFSRVTRAVSWVDAMRRYRRAISEADQKQGINAGWLTFRLVEMLELAGVLEWVAKLVDGPDFEARDVHPLSLHQCGALAAQGVEHELGLCANAAAMAMLERLWGLDEDELIDRLDSKFGEAEFMLPIDRIVQNVQVIGVPRLRYRPNTRRTSRWMAELSEQAVAYAQGYLQIIKTYAPEKLAELDLSRLGFDCTG